MLDKETYKREYIRMMDSMRNENKGEENCNGVDCYKCPIGEQCRGDGSSVFEIIEAVEKWAKEHPIVTNADKFKEVFGRAPRTLSGYYPCMGVFLGNCSKDCDTCKKDFWEAEYKAPEKSEVKE